MSEATVIPPSSAHDACRAQLERVKAQTDQLAYAVSHDLVAHVRHLNGFLALLESSDGARLTQDGRESLEFCTSAARSLGQMCEALLAYSRIGRKEAPFEQVDLGAAVERALETFDEAQRPVVTHAGLPVIHAEPEQMVELWRHLLGNAAKFRSPDRPPAVAIVATGDGQGWDILVTDNGMGVAQRDWNAMFGMFVQLQARGSIPGVGAGLALAKRIVERHGGSLAVANSSEAGTTFYMRFPGGFADAPSR